MEMSLTGLKVLHPASKISKNENQLFMVWCPFPLEEYLGVV